MTPIYDIRPALPSDLGAIKALCDKHRLELGFVLRPSLEKSIELGELYVAVVDTQLVGFVHYHHRRDRQTTLYHLAVDPQYRRSGIASSLIEALLRECQAHSSIQLLLKCPSELPSNQFYANFGFHHERIDNGKHRALNVWVIEMASWSSLEIQNQISVSEAG